MLEAFQRAQLYGICRAEKGIRNEHNTVSFGEAENNLTTTLQICFLIGCRNFLLGGRWSGERRAHILAFNNLGWKKKATYISSSLRSFAAPFLAFSHEAILQHRHMFTWQLLPILIYCSSMEDGRRAVSDRTNSELFVVLWKDGY